MRPPSPPRKSAAERANEIRAMLSEAKALNPLYSKLQYEGCDSPPAGAASGAPSSQLILEGEGCAAGARAPGGASVAPPPPPAEPRSDTFQHKNKEIKQTTKKLKIK